MRSLCCCLVMLAMLPASAQEVWRGLRWDMPIDRAQQTLSRQDLKVEADEWRKTGESNLSIDVDGWDTTVYFDPDGRMTQITLNAETLTKEAAAAAKERLTKRFGAPNDVSVDSTLSWGRPFGTKDPWTELRVVRGLEDGWVAYENYARGNAKSPVGAFDLTWGQPTVEVERHLRAAGFDAQTTPEHPDPCEMPNSPMFCEHGANVVVHFRKDGDAGEATVHRKRGLEQIRFTARVASHADGLARAKPIEAFQGPPTEIEEATVTTWSDAASNVTLDVRLTKPAGTLSASEEYLRASVPRLPADGQ
jgi:YD repeat-containing protein